MDKTKILEVFNEVLEEWYWAEDVVIHDRSISPKNLQLELDKRRQSYQEDFIRALES